MKTNKTWLGMIPSYLESDEDIDDAVRKLARRQWFDISRYDVLLGERVGSCRSVYLIHRTVETIETDLL